MAPKGAVFVIPVMQCRMLDLQDFSLRTAMQGELLEELFLFSSVKPVNSKADFRVPVPPDPQFLVCRTDEFCGTDTAFVLEIILRA